MLCLTGNVLFEDYIPGCTVCHSAWSLPIRLFGDVESSKGNYWNPTFQLCIIIFILYYTLPAMHMPCQLHSLLWYIHNIQFFCGLLLNLVYHLSFKDN